MTPQELKNSILQLAIQGKLVEQRPEEGTAEELYQQIQAEKQALINAGKIKNEKPLPEITEDDIPFEIPESWKWVHYSDLFDIGSAIRIHQTDWKTEGIPFFRGRELVRLAKTGDPDAEIYISRELYEKNKAKGGVPQKGDLLVTAVGTLGKVYIVQGTHPFYYKDAYILRYNNYSKLFSEYFKYVIESPFIQDFISQGSMGTTVAQLTIEKAKRMICPIPPLAEQKRIVAKIEELLPLIDRYEKAWTRLEDFIKRFPGDMQKSILQMAIQGKLVEQRAEEGTGEDLYKQIQAEKLVLIKAGKIKKEKPLPEIAEDEKPFEIPESWKWVQLKEIVSIRGGKRLPKGEKLSDIPTKHIYIRVTDMQNGTILDNDLHYISDDVYNRIAAYTIEESDVYIVIVGSTIGKVGLVPSIFHGMNLTENAARLIPIMINKYFLYYLLTSYSIQNQFLDKTKQVGQPKLALFRLESTWLPLPPLAEQKRIVAKLEELMPLCDKLRKNANKNF